MNLNDINDILRARQAKAAQKGVETEVLSEEELKKAAEGVAGEEQTDIPEGEKAATDTDAHENAAGEEAKSELSEDVKNMAAQLITKEKENEEISARLMRLQADFDNFRRRTEKDKEELSKFVTSGVVNKFLDVMDNLERAEQAGSKALDAQSVLDGVINIKKQFSKVLDELGVKEIEAEGKEFDPAIHEAVMRGQNPDMKDDTVAAVFQKGYILGDHVIRHSKVQVINND